ncbi:SDR family oxidoreductase [Peribacillus butanolivorans]|uniref:SDR family oxidoreductase n=1 Tax=Peribacillus butanolivorans TaxID=421767 RepID=UPI003655DF9D
MEHVYLFTGFPGFISNQLIMELLRRDEALNKIYLLVLPEQKVKAEAEIKSIENELDGAKVVFEMVIGYITKENLDIPFDLIHNLQQEITHVFHLAAIYDLAVPEKIAQLVNVVGTKHVNEWVKGLTKLKRYTYFSTAYVAGNRGEICTSMNWSFQKALRTIMNGLNLTPNYWSRSLKKRFRLP